MNAHTPGPWEVGKPGNGEPGYVYCNNSLGSAVAIVYGPALPYPVFSRAEEEANARLIAAAPDGYTANMASITVLSALLNTDLHPNMRKDVEFALEAARAAVEKAEGTT